ncbi:TssN family type VI secretion system protein [Tenacibaculum sp.]|nr:TssN family type VI secretion system protein [Tenacibaculum sp.]
MGLNRLMQGDFFKVSLLFFIAGSFFMLILTDIRKLFTENKKKAIVYALIILVVFALVGLLSSSKVLNDTPLNSFVGFQLLFLILGAVHLWVLRTFFKKLSEDRTTFFSEFFFTLAFVFIGLIAFFKVTETFRSPFKFIFLSSVITFLVPLLFYKLYEFALLIPVKVYKQWLYPMDGNVKEPTSEELKNPLVISFEFKKTGEEDDEVTNFRVKAPENLEFGKLFYFFLNDYNERHPEGTVTFLDTDNKSQKWVFFRKPSFFKSLKHIDYSKTITANNLKEDDVIICQRS